MAEAAKIASPFSDLLLMLMSERTVSSANTTGGALPRC